MKKDYGNKQVYFVGGGLGSLAGAVYLIRDCDFPAQNIHIMEAADILGGSNDGAGDAAKGYVCRGGRMFQKDTYENCWELFSSIPSLDQPGWSVCEDILEFDKAHPTHANARLIDKDGEIVDITSMGFDPADSIAYAKLLIAPEEKLDNVRICDWFGPHFFETNFWYLWSTTFAFQKWSSVFEFRRYSNRLILEFPRFQTLGGVTRSPYNQYDSVILPIKTYLDSFGVDFTLKCTVTDLDFAEGDDITVTAIHYEAADGKGAIKLNDGDLCFVTLGSITDNAAIGDYKTPAKFNTERPKSFDLWANMAAKKPGLGNPAPFIDKPEETNWASLTVTMKGDKLLKRIEKYSRNKPGSGALMTFRDSSWYCSIVVAAQPHFRNQPEDVTVLWADFFATGEEGNYVKKPMRDCTGEEVLIELLHHLHFEDELDEIMATVINAIPCNMPFLDGQFQPRKMSDRPKPVPEGSTNLGLFSQFVEIPDEIVFTEECSVRAARMAVYTLMGLPRKVCPITPHKDNVRALVKAAITSTR